MNRSIVLFSFAFVLCAAAVTASDSLAIIDTTLIPMDAERTITHQTVVVTDGRIAAIGPSASTAVPDGARRIDGRGKFLIPGLADMHTHVDRVELLPLFVRSGVTTILNMGLANPRFVARDRRLADRGTEPAPHVFAAFMIDGPGDPGPQFVPACPADARAAVDRAQLLGYEFIKVYSRLQPEIFDAVLDEAHKIGMPVAGHIATAVGLEKSLASGQVMIAHAEEYWKTYLGEREDAKRIADAVALTHDAGAYVTPNLSFFALLTELTATPDIADTVVAGRDARLMPPDLLAGWEGRKPAKPSDRFVPELHALQTLTLALSRADVPLLAGTDTPIFGMVPGASLDDDLQRLVAAGLTPYQALSAATRVPGEFIRKFVPAAEAFGTIAAGNRGDLVLLDANPLQSIANTRRIGGAAVRGRWFTEAEAEAIATKHESEYDAIRDAEKKFLATIDQQGVATAITSVEAATNIPESFFNTQAYRLLNARKLDNAIAIFALNTRLHPDSWNAWDSLGEAELDAGHTEAAIEDYRVSLGLNARNAGAQRALRKLTGS